MFRKIDLFSTIRYDIQATNSIYLRDVSIEQSMIDGYCCADNNECWRKQVRVVLIRLYDGDLLQLF